jgi:hypothetical protein
MGVPLGFEITFDYYDKNPNGIGYNIEKLQNFKKVVGNKTEEYPIEKLATFIIKQLARRDILVNNVEVYEYTKKKIAFKENKGGITIKGNKFDFENTNISLVEEEEEIPETKLLEQPKPKSEHKIKVVSPKINAMRYETFDPDNGEIVGRLQKKGIYLTPQKMYPILEEVLTNTEVTNSLNGNQQMSQEVYNYKILDDNNKECIVSFTYFRPKVILSYTGEQQYNGQQTNNQFDMPLLRRGM